MKRILPLLFALALPLLTACGSAPPAAAASSAGSPSPSAASSASAPAPIPDGSYTDDMGSRLTLRTQPDGTYLVDFGIYKLCWVEDAPGAWEAGILHFEGTDDSGQPLSANVTAREGGLLLTVAESGHPDCRRGRSSSLPRRSDKRKRRHPKGCRRFLTFGQFPEDGVPVEAALGEAGDLLAGLAEAEAALRQDGAHFRVRIGAAVGDDEGGEARGPPATCPGNSSPPAPRPGGRWP